MGQSMHVGVREVLAAAGLGLSRDKAFAYARLHHGIKSNIPHRWAGDDADTAAIEAEVRTLLEHPLHGPKIKDRL